MSADVWQPVVAALATLAVALLTYLTAQVRANSARLDAHAAALLTGQAARAVAPAGGGATATPPTRAPAYPLWNQLADPNSDGTLPAQRYTECGEECVSEILFRQHGVAVPADYLRYELGGPGRPGITSASDLQRLLALNNVAAVVQAPPAAGLAAALQAITREGRAAIVLGAWVTPGVLHWILVDVASAAGASFNDPWGGVRRTATWPVLTGQYAGQLVEVTRTPDARP